ncbi:MULTISPECIES: hypothetical protein [unclassified Bradyrhizobium]|uniref:hypothetical protein n=1 Tax=unclassified Bradyrhizobium TaxID=2631580 RepID=UPI0028E7341F|nr:MULTISPECIES: hypothetical protein [unclassified Bradyrhizobium]
MSWNEAEIEAARDTVLKTAQDMLAGNLTYIEGARKIVVARWAARLNERDADILAFIGIDSETEALPVGPIRKYWQRSALDALQPEIDRSEAWARGFGERHCRNLIHRLSK